MTKNYSFSADLIFLSFFFRFIFLFSILLFHLFTCCFEKNLPTTSPDKNLTQALRWKQAIFTLTLGHNPLIVRFVSAVRPNLKLENVTFLGQKNEVSTTSIVPYPSWDQGGNHFCVISQAEGDNC